MAGSSLRSLSERLVVDSLAGSELAGETVSLRASDEEHDKVSGDEVEMEVPRLLLLLLMLELANDKDDPVALLASVLVEESSSSSLVTSAQLVFG